MDRRWMLEGLRVAVRSEERLFVVLQGLGEVRGEGAVHGVESTGRIRNDCQCVPGW